MDEMYKVAVVGAGAAGLCCARYLKSNSDHFTFTVFEKAKEVGGTWVYTDRTDRDEYGLPVHSSMMAELRTNIPKEIMDFPDLPFREDLPSFIGHSDVLQYLQDFATRFNLHENIKFHTNVELVEPLTEEPGVSLEEDHQSGRKMRRRREDIGIIPDNVKWMVHTRDLETGALSKDIFDSVLLCPGHFSKPYIPVIPGLDNFPGKVIHSHAYRTAESFTDERVLVVGAGHSGNDVFLWVSAVAQFASLVYHKSPVTFKLPPNSEQQPSIVGMDSNGTVRFKNGLSRMFDSIILCTGYEYDYPFLRSDSGIVVQDSKHVQHLYKHTFNIKYPSMAFVGLVYPVSPFFFFDRQVQCIMSVLKKDTRLPCQEDMMADCHAEYERQLREGVPHQDSHRVNDYIDLIRELTEIGGLEPHHPKYDELKVAGRHRIMDIVNYRKYDYSMSKDSEGRVILSRQLRDGEKLVS